ncbi:DUF4047 domain-containing protein [Bacillus sp. XF8]|uniref:DUF4047 domain-containing protein n=1 Tax=Bacillus sp. XF8 TaxID=2819289 RepID=UPI001AA023F9|nr:DUF4047 domain-containing protein [Bacillus sp. XF8]MBO1578184.1 DUF4047 domain-containing protein [Bacillus sp. XF8]
MSKTSKRIKAMLILPCMCSGAFYMGSQIVTHTEAAFVKEQKVQAVISAAPVFPKTIDVLKNDAQQHEQSILHAYDEMNKELETNSVEALEKKLNLWKQQREKIVPEREALQNIYVEIESYYNQLVEREKDRNLESNQQIIHSTQTGVEFIKKICENVDKQVNLQKIDEQIQGFQKQIDDEKEKQKLSEQAKEVEKPAEQIAPPEKKEEIATVEETIQHNQLKEEKHPKETETGNPPKEQSKEQSTKVAQ